MKISALSRGEYRCRCHHSDQLQQAGRILCMASMLMAMTATRVLSAQTEPSGSTAQATQASVPAHVPYTWGHVQIVAGGFITGIVGHPLDSNIRYARTDIGGTYRWDADSQRWTPLMEFLDNAQSNYIGSEAIGLDPNDTDTLYVASGTYMASFAGNGAMLVSRDRGRHFIIEPMPIRMGSNDAGRSAGERIVVDPNKSSDVYFGSRADGLWVSHDRGISWGKVANFPVTGPTGSKADAGVGVIFGYFDKRSGVTASGATKVAYFGVSDPGVGLYVTVDGGTSYVPVHGQPKGMYPNSLATDPSGNLYIAYGYSDKGNSVGPYAMSAGAIWKYSPGADPVHGVWSDITPPNPKNERYGYGSVAVDWSRPNVILVSTMDRYYPPPQDDIFRSIDGGKTWKSLSTNSIRDSSLSPWVTFGAPSAKAGNWLNHLWINPQNGDEVLYGNGETIWRTTDISAADSVKTSRGVIVVGGTTHWSIGALGVEETAVGALTSPTVGPAHLLSGMGDLSGFTHTTLTRSPPQGANRVPDLGYVSSLDFVALQPLDIVRVGRSAPFGAYSVDGGLHFTAFPTVPREVRQRGAGTVAASADGKTILWAPEDPDAATYYTTDVGKTWQESSGSPRTKARQRRMDVVTDRIDLQAAYLYNPASGAVYRSDDGGRNFEPGAAMRPDGELKVSQGAKGDLWLVNGGLLDRSTDGGRTFYSICAVTKAYNFGFGASAPGTKTPSIYLRGEIGGYPKDYVAFFASFDAGATWAQISDADHQFGNAGEMTGDSRVFGRVYIATNGFGIVQGDRKDVSLAVTGSDKQAPCEQRSSNPGEHGAPESHRDAPVKSSH